MLKVYTWVHHLDFCSGRVRMETARRVRDASAAQPTTLWKEGMTASRCR